MKKIVLTGGPCAGKTTLTQVISRVFHEQIVVVPEAASLLFSGGFPRWQEEESRKATQRAIYHVQCDLESSYATHHPDKVLVLDRGTLDGAAYWSEGVDHFFPALGTTIEAELRRYDCVFYLESAAEKDYQIHRKKNPNRIETWEEAHALDLQTQKLWAMHPCLKIIPNQHSFSFKISEVLRLLEAELASFAN